VTEVRPFVSRRRSGATFAILMVSSLVLVGLNPPPGHVGLLSLVQTGITTGSRWVAGTVTAIGELSRSRAEVQMLRADLARLEQRQRGVVQLEVEIRNLRALLNLTRAAAGTPIPAEVIGRDPGNLFKTITINRGRRHGVRVDATVVADAGGVQALVGRVESVSSLTAMVRPLLASSSYVGARLQRTEHDGLIEGDPAGKRLVMRYVPRIAAEDLAIDDLVITSGMGGLYPRGIHIGRVVEHRAGEERSSLHIIVKPLVEFGRLDYVLVLDTAERPDG
jgi:rod shape-determining protein MreC